MVKGFTTRKIKGGKTLAERLRSTRLRQGLSLEEAEIGSKVRSRYIEALEKGDWSGLPSDAYIRGFVLSYAKFLGISKEEIRTLFETELLARRHQPQPELSYRQSAKDVKVLITPKLIGYAALSIFVLAMFSYIIYQVSNFAGSPNLKIATPTDNAILDTDTVDVRGVTDTDIYLSINGESIPVTNDGHFSTNLKLHRGVNVVQVNAVNKAKKETTEVLTIEYKPATAMVDSQTNQ